MRLLRGAAAGGEIIPRNFDQQWRLDRLDLEGYVQASPRDGAEPTEPAHWIYRLTRKGQQAAGLAPRVLGAGH